MITSVWQLINPTSAMDQSAGLLSDTAELEPPLSSIYLSETPTAIAAALQTLLPPVAVKNPSQFDKSCEKLCF